MSLREIEALARRRQVTATGCWEWSGATNGYGYGVVSIRNSRHYVHRLSYQLAEGAIPARHVVDHLCENTLCFNPIHLEPVTHKENIRRASKVGGKKRCNHGHSYSPANTYITPAGARQCRICKLRRARAANARRRQEIRR